jgi:hypothetical protein
MQIQYVMWQHGLLELQVDIVGLDLLLVVA